MPAKAKYLSSGWARFSRVTAAIVGSYVVTMLLHVAAAKVAPNNTPVILTAAYSSFLVWVGLMVLAFWMKKVAHVWSLYALLTGISALLILT
ncbi:hypothetical protein [Tunicatimonas pelagia]|uniref:hypothetical protein n=1 Tax=Tunicatimonas pelagia TaxID=931531 RepID=UPI0026657443|nr:hypothetical protein [Tunicatimonas pelagia]WKN42994.1 hypothetical protein P0M28_28550 [Tunicatimonas pelagia]